MSIPISRTAAAPRQPYLPALTGLRFVLALWVVVHHLVGPGGILEPQFRGLMPSFQMLVGSGYLAVETFFILSGFVLARSCAAVKSWDRRSLIRFGMARFARVYPVFALSMVAMSPFIAETLAKPGRSAIQKVEVLGQYLFLLIGWLTARGVGWNTPSWSLTCEVFFYLCFPALFLWLRNASMRRLFAVLAASFVLPIVLLHSAVPLVWKPIHTLPDFVAGIVAAKLFERAGSTGKGYWLYLPALIGAMLLIGHPEALNGTYMDVTTALIPFNVIALIGFAMSGGWLARILSTRVFDYLGQASYSMYILHIPVLWWYTRFAFDQRGEWPHTGASIAYLVVVTIVSMAAFELVEKPANRWLRDWSDRRLSAAVRRTPAPLRQEFDTPAAPYSPVSVPAASESAY